MLGFSQPSPSNDICVFFEGAEVERLGSNPILGTYFTLSDSSRNSFYVPVPTGILEVSIDDEIRSIIHASIDRNQEGVITWLQLRIRTAEYGNLKENGRVGSNDIPRKIFLLDAQDPSKLDLNYKQSYATLQECQPQYSQAQTFQV